MLKGLPGAFLTPKRPPKRCENATVRSQLEKRLFSGVENPTVRGFSFFLDPSVQIETYLP